jgi:hypothetical protein
MPANPLGSILEFDCLELLRGHAEQRPAAFGEAAERVVMMHHGLAIGGELQVDFDVEISIDRSPDRSRHIFDDASREVMQAAVGNRSRRQPVWRAHPTAPL